MAFSVGLYGKLPARGDFVRTGLPRDFTDPWDEWLQLVMAGSRSLVGDDAWLPAFLEAPVWRFVLPPGMCGPQAVLGLMLPSVDRAGRYFPLTFAALGPRTTLRECAEAWLDICEAAGRQALEQDTPPQVLAGKLEAPELPEAEADVAEATWWSEGSPRVRPTCLSLRGLPDVATFAAMLGLQTSGTDVAADGSGPGDGKLRSPS
jgi:type VI secretion system protein ImpM